MPLSKTTIKFQEEIAPFGNPDGSRAPLEDVLERFIGFGGSAAWGGLGTRADDLSARVIVGRKGSGKTVYLRRQQAHTSHRPDLFVDTIEQGLPSTENIIRFCEWFDEQVLTEKWMELWRCAILLSLASHLLHNTSLTSHIQADLRPKLLDLFTDLAPGSETPTSIYSQLSAIITNHHSWRISEFLEDTKWHTLEYFLGRAIETCPPICLYIDAVDEEFAHAPMHWHRCQKGLFYRVMRFLRDSRLGGRLHIFICIRDIVYASILQSEHATRYISEPHIRILKWDRHSITYFFNKKLERLSDVYFSSRKGATKSLFADWLGFDVIENTRRHIVEDPIWYLLRHSRLLPRDIIILGNSLCSLITKATITGQPLSQPEIRQRIALEAKSFGDEQLKICAHQIAASGMPRAAARHGYSHTYTADQEYVRGICEDLKNVIRGIGKDKFTETELVAAAQSSRSIFGDNMDIFTVLWQNGLLGFIDKHSRVSMFFDDFDSRDFHYPCGKSRYVFHACLIDAVGIRAIGKRPV